MEHDSKPVEPALNDRAEAASVEVREAIRTLRSALDRLEASLNAPPAARAATAPVPPVETYSDETDEGPKSEAELDSASHFESTWTPPPVRRDPEPQEDPIPIRAETPTQQPAQEVSWPSWSVGSPFTEPAAWPYPRPGASSPEGEESSKSLAEPESAPADREARDQVRRAVEQMRAELESAAPTVDEDSDAVGSTTGGDAGVREQARHAVGQMQAELAEGAGERSAGDASAGTDAAMEEDAREQVRRAVDRMRAEIAHAGRDAAQTAVPAESGDDRTTEVADPAAAQPGPEIDIREQVRRAVEAARAEIGGADEQPTKAGSIVEAFDPERLRIPHYEPVLNERFLQPAIIVIDDPEGRVELVRVYRTLARLEVAATANLANYSSHSVTVQLEERAVPAEEQIVDAIVYAFERDCSIDVDGNRASVRLASGKTKVA
jgi:hypothetical protein